MNYITSIASICHEANRQFCRTLGDHSQVHWDDAPNWQRKSAILGVQKVIEGLSPAELHVSWMQQKIEDGWVYGEVKDPEKKTHPCMVNYDDLPLEQRKKDSLFHAVAKALLGV